MNICGDQKVPIEVVSGLVTFMDAEDLPSGVSPDCADVQFKPGVPGSVATRPGLTNIQAFAGSITYMKTYTDGQGNDRNLYLDEAANLVEEFPAGTFSTILNQASGIQMNSFAKSVTGYGSEFIAFSNGKFGNAIPRRIVSSTEQSTYDRLSQVGPGIAPGGIADFSFPLTSINRASGVINGQVFASMTTGFAIGKVVSIAGVNGDVTIDGQYPIFDIGGPFEDFFEAWGNPGIWSVNAMVRAANIVTAVFQQTPTFNVADQIIVADSEDPSFDGLFTVASISGNIVTWADADVNANTLGATVYTKTYVGVIYNVSPIGLGQPLTGGIPAVAIIGPVAGGFTPGSNVIIAGVNVTAWNGTYLISSAFPPIFLPPNSPDIAGPNDGAALQNGVTIVYFVPPSLPSTSTGYGGTATSELPDSSPAPTGVAGPAGNISIGEHQLSVIFITENGYFTAPPQPTAWVAQGGFQAVVSLIPTGPPNVIARLLVLTAAGGANFFFSQAAGEDITSFLIPDNTTTTFTIDFSDAAILSATSADLLFDRIELPEVAALEQYSDRIFAWGARNRVENFVNMSMDGGQNSEGLTPPQGIPLGWTPVNYAGPLVSGVIPSTLFGFDYYIGTNGGPPGIYGEITQPAWQDYLGVAILSPLTNYGLRIWLKQSALDPYALSGTLTAQIYSPTAGVVSTALVNLDAVGTIYSEFDVNFNDETPATIPQDSVLQIYMTSSSFIPTNTLLQMKNIEIYPLDQPYQTSVMLASNVADPEAFQGTTGFMNVNENDGRRLVSGYVIRDRFYMTKNRGGIYVTSDDQTDEPSSWEIDTISRRVGTESINSCGSVIGNEGEDWVFLLAREGFYIYWSTEPAKISQEIQPTWDLINWEYAYTAWVTIDTARRRVLIGVPTGESTTPNVIYTMDYQMIGSAQDIADSPAVSPTYTGQLKSHARSRKWTIWNIKASAGGAMENEVGQSEIRISSGFSGPELCLLDESALLDFGSRKINGYYTTNFYPTDEQKQTPLQTEGNRIFFGMMTCAMDGIGDFECEVFGPGFIDSVVIPRSEAPAIVLASPASDDIETIIDFSAERMALKLMAQNSETPQFSFQRADLYMAADPVMQLRGYN